MHLGVGDLTRLHPIADRCCRQPRLDVTEPARFLAEIFLELVPGKTRLIAALERYTLELSINIAFVKDRFFVAIKFVQFAIGNENLIAPG